jgi:hypothetical protein
MYYKVAQHTNIYKYLHISYFKNYFNSLQSVLLIVLPKPARQYIYINNALLPFNFFFKTISHMMPYSLSGQAGGRGFLFFFTGKYIQFEDWINQYGKNIYSTGIVTFLKGKIFSPRGLSLLPREKHFHHGDCHFYHGKNIFTTEIVTFTTGKTFSPRRLSLLPREKHFHHGDCHFYHGKNIFSTGIVTFTKGKIFSP